MYDTPTSLSSRRRAVRPSPLFLTVVAVAVLGGVIAWTQDAPGSRFGDFGVLLMVLGGWVMSVCFHEFAHAYAAWRAGDRSVEQRGYLTLNPFKYTHPFLSIILPVVAIIAGGFALPGGAVYLHPHSFRSKATRAWAAAVGPLTNVVFAAVLIFVARSHGIANQVDARLFYADHGRFWAGVAFLGFLQATAAVLNLIPVPGLDGYGIIEPYLDPETRRIGDKIKPWGLLVVIVVVFYLSPLKTAFFDLVYFLFRLVGGYEGQYLSELGSAFFQFWSKTPL